MRDNVVSAVIVLAGLVGLMAIAWHVYRAGRPKRVTTRGRLRAAWLARGRRGAWTELDTNGAHLDWALYRRDGRLP